MLRIVKPKNARSKRALDARAPKEIEDPRTVLFVRGTHTGEVVNGVMRELLALKRPNVISFSKKNAVRPFEDTTSLDFWSRKNDASFFCIGQSTKKRPDGLTLARMYDEKVLDICEFGVDRFSSIAEFKGSKSTPGHKPLMHFSSELFDTHPRYMQVKSMMMDFFNAEVIDSVCLSGLEHVISVSLSPTPPSLNTATTGDTASADLNSLPKVHIRTYRVRLLSSGARIPRVELTPMGPYLDLSLRRHQPPDGELWKAAMRRPKMKKQDVEQGLGKKKKNLEVDEMGDLRGKLHVAKQDLERLQTRKMKGLKRMHGGDSDESEDGSVHTGRPKRRTV